jgi:hypothetical protein
LYAILPVGSDDRAQSRSAMSSLSRDRLRAVAQMFWTIAALAIAMLAIMESALAEAAYPEKHLGAWSIASRPGGCKAATQVGSGEISVWAALIFFEHRLSGDTTYTLSVSDRLVPGPTIRQPDSGPTKKVSIGEIGDFWLQLDGPTDSADLTKQDAVRFLLLAHEISFRGVRVQFGAGGGDVIAGLLDCLDHERQQITGDPTGSNPTLVDPGSQATARADCLSYGGRVQLTGTLLRIVFPGPPNYESIARGDQAEPQFVIRLDKAVCVNASPNDDFAVFVSSIRDMMLVLNPPQFGQLQPRLGARVILSGSLMPAETGHHHTPVMLSDVVLIQ